MTQETKSSPQTRRSALFGFAEHVWSIEKSRWVLRPRWKPIASTILTLLVLGYLSLAGVYYAINRWHRNAEDTSYREMLLFVFPDPIYGTNIHWAPDFVMKPVEAARLSHRHKMAALLFGKAKVAMQNQDWRNFFHNIFAASQLDPSNMEARLLSAQAFFSLRRDDDALESLEEPLLLMLGKPDYVREFIRACFAKEQDARVVGVTKYLLQQKEMDPQVRELLNFALASAHFFRGEFDACGRLIQKENLARTRDGFLLWIRLNWETGRRDEAIAALEPVAMSAKADPTFFALLMDWKKQNGQIEGAKASASLYIIGAPENYQARIKLIELLESPSDKARRDENIANYRRDFAGKEAPLLLLCEFAADRGLTDLCGELVKDAATNKFAEAPRFQLLYIESNLSAGRYEETVNAVDNIYLKKPAWLPKYNQVFDCLRMVAQMAMKREDMAEIGFRKMAESSKDVPLPLMTMVAKKLVTVNRPDDAMRVIDLAFERNGKTSMALANVVDIHLGAGGGPATPGLVRKLILTRRPSGEVLRKARDILAGDAFLFEPDRTKLIADLDTLLAGKPILPDEPARPPIKKSKE